MAQLPANFQLLSTYNKKYLSVKNNSQLVFVDDAKDPSTVFSAENIGGSGEFYNIRGHYNKYWARSSENWIDSSADKQSANLFRAIIVDYNKNTYQFLHIQQDRLAHISNDVVHGGVDRFSLQTESYLRDSSVFQVISN